MKVKIEIKHWITGFILFEYEKENNTIKDTLIKAAEGGKDLTGADLTGADLRRADLTGAYLTGAYLKGAYLTGAYLTGAYGEKIVIKKAAVFTGLYKYICIPFISEDNKFYIKMGCYTRLVEDWEKDFWNNTNEFPNDNSLKSQYRVMAYEFCKQWLELNK